MPSERQFSPAVKDAQTALLQREAVPARSEQHPLCTDAGHGDLAAPVDEAPRFALPDLRQTALKGERFVPNAGDDHLAVAVGKPSFAVLLRTIAMPSINGEASSQTQGTATSPRRSMKPHLPPRLTCASPSLKWPAPSQTQGTTNSPRSLTKPSLPSCLTHASPSSKLPASSQTQGTTNSPRRSMKPHLPPRLTAASSVPEIVRLPPRRRARRGRPRRRSRRNRPAARSPRRRTRQSCGQSAAWKAVVPSHSLPARRRAQKHNLQSVDKPRRPPYNRYGKYERKSQV